METIKNVICIDMNVYGDQEPYCRETIHYFENVVFLTNLLIIAGFGYIIQIYFVGMMEPRDPLSSTDPLKLDLFPLVYLIDACIKYIPNWDHDEINLEERVTDIMTFFVTMIYSYFYRNHLFFFNETTSRIIKIGLGWIIYHSFRRFLDTFYEDNATFVKVEQLTSILDYSLGLRIIYNIIIERQENIEINLDSSEPNMVGLKKIFETMQFLQTHKYNKNMTAHEIDQ